MTSRLRQLGLGRLAYRMYHAPVGRLRASLAAGGPLEQWRTARGRRAMQAAARELPPLTPQRDAPHFEVHVLTGRRFWEQTTFCLWSFARQSAVSLTPVIHDDGTLTPELLAPITQVFPHTRIDLESEIVARLDRFLPASRFPVLRARRQEFPLLRKLTDVHAGSSGWKLFLDSDMLFFHRPQLLIDWLAAPSQPLRATDISNCYGYSLDLLAELAGRPVPELVNTGLLGLRSDEIDWERMEHWCRALIDRVGTHYYQEQALIALHLAGQPHHIAPISDYVTLPRSPEVTDCRAVMHHYVADSKPAYFRDNWRRALEAAP